MLLLLFALLLVTDSSCYQFHQYEPCVRTLGFLHRGLCYYLENRKDMSRGISNLPMGKDKREFLDLFHLLTRHYYGLFGKTLVESPWNEITLKRLNLLRLPSFPMQNGKCLVYDSSTNQIYDEHDNCSTSVFLNAYKDPFVGIVIENPPSLPVWNQEKEESTNLEYPDCFLISGKEDCEMFEINSRKRFQWYMNFVTAQSKMFRDRFRKMKKVIQVAQEKGLRVYNTHIVHFDQSKVALKPGDSMMHVSTYTNYSSPAGCHISDLSTGKLFQQPDCETAANILKNHYFDEPLEYALRLCKKPTCSSLSD